MAAFVELTILAVVVAMSVPAQIVAALYLDLDRGAFGLWVLLNIGVTAVGLHVGLASLRRDMAPLRAWLRDEVADPQRVRDGEVHEDAGHLHVMVDAPCVEPGQTIPSDAQHVHLGMAQLETALDLTPGEHTLCLQAGDGTHTALAITREITITVT